MVLPAIGLPPEVSAAVNVVKPPYVPVAADTARVVPVDTAVTVISAVGPVPLTV